MLKSSIEKLMRRENLESFFCQKILTEILEEQSDPLQIASFLVLLRAKPETTDELTAIVSSLREKMVVVPTQYKVLDIVGTGGDGANTVNISTGSAILAASCGVKIAKHGNRAVSSLVGAADVLEALGVNIELSPEKISACIKEIGIGFCFSPNFHPAICKLRSLRKQLNVPTTLNLLGPLLNPANANHFLLGVLDEALLPVIANVLKQTGTEKSIVVHGSGLDEISCVGTTKIIEISQTGMISSIIDPIKFGLPRCSINDLKGGNTPYNAQLLLDAFGGKKGGLSNTLILNAAVALYLYGLYPSIGDAVGHASENLFSKKALTLLNNWREYSHD